MGLIRDLILGPRDVEDPAPVWAQNLVMLLLLLAGVAAAAAILVYVTGADTQLLGLALGAMFLLFAAASITASRRLVPQEEIEEPIAFAQHERAQAEVADTAAGVKRRITRRRMLLGALGGSAGIAGGALVVPAASLGPLFKTDLLRDTAWAAGKALVDVDGAPIKPGDIAVGSFMTAFPQGEDKRRLDAAVVLVRLKPDELELPDARRGWVVDGVLAFSKACTHAGCAVSEFRYPSFEPTGPGPRLVCPCHYSEFDPATGGTVKGGPAGRPLPQLPLRLRGDGTLEAAGGYSGPPGPAWAGVRD
jgi:quinol---cytochrome c reductase iron-sulfur subunit